MYKKMKANEKLQSDIKIYSASISVGKKKRTEKEYTGFKFTNDYVSVAILTA